MCQVLTRLQLRGDIVIELAYLRKDPTDGFGRLALHAFFFGWDNVRSVNSKCRILLDVLPCAGFGRGFQTPNFDPPPPFPVPPMRFPHESQDPPWFSGVRIYFANRPKIAPWTWAPVQNVGTSFWVCFKSEPDLTLMDAKCVWHHLEIPGMMRFPCQKTNNQWFLMVSK